MQDFWDFIHVAAYHINILARRTMPHTVGKENSSTIGVGSNPINPLVKGHSFHDFRSWCTYGNHLIICEGLHLWSVHLMVDLDLWPILLGLIIARNCAK